MNKVYKMETSLYRVILPTQVYTHIRWNQAATDKSVVKPHVLWRRQSFRNAVLRCPAINRLLY